MRCLAHAPEGFLRSFMWPGGLQSQTAQVLIPALPFASCATPGKLLTLSVLRFPLPKKGIIIRLLSSFLE